MGYKKENKIKALHSVSDYLSDLAEMYKKHEDVMTHNMRSSILAEMSFIGDVREEMHKDIYGENN